MINTTIAIPKEKMNEYRRRYYKKHKFEINKKRRQNRERYKKYHDKYVAANREMVLRKKRVDTNDEGTIKANTKGDIIQRPISITIAKRKIRTSGDLIKLMCVLMRDVITEDANPNIVNAAVGAARQINRTLEMNLKYGIKNVNKALRAEE